MPEYNHSLLCCPASSPSWPLVILIGLTYHGLSKCSKLLHRKCQATLAPAISCWPAPTAADLGTYVMFLVALEAAVLGCGAQP